MIDHNYWSTIARRANIHISTYDNNSTKNESTENQVLPVKTVTGNSDMEWYKSLKSRYDSYLMESKMEEDKFYDNIEREYRLEKQKLKEIEEDKVKMERLSKFLRQLKNNNLIPEGSQYIEEEEETPLIDRSEPMN